MTILEEVIVQNTTLTGVSTRTIDWDVVLNFPDKKFEQYYLELMTEYRDKNGYWTKRKIPCDNCHQIISGPEQLRRYYGRSLHPICFKEEWKKERLEKKEPTLVAYFDRVAQLTLGE